MKQLIKVGLLALISASLLCLSKGRLYGQAPNEPGVPLNLTLRGSSTISTGNDGGDPIDRFRMFRLNWGVSDFLGLIGNYPAGTKLVFDGGDIWTVDRSGQYLDDLTAEGYVTVSLDPNGMGVWSGQVNNDTGALKFTGSYISMIQFDLPTGDQGEESGVTKETYSLTAPDRNGVQRASDTMSMSLAGEGTLLGSNDVGTMTVSGSGRATFFNGKLVAVAPNDAAGDSSTP